MRVIFAGQILHGKLKLHDYDRELFDKKLRELEGKPVEVTMERAKSHHSDSQRKYYWAVVVRMIQLQIGDDRPEDTHEALKKKFNPVRKDIVNKATGEIEVIEIGGTTTTMTTVEFSDYIERIMRWAAQWLGLVIPDAERVEV